MGLQAILTSPRFLFRVELDPAHGAPDAHALDDFELATRLSYFLWSSTPDEELLAAARSGDAVLFTENYGLFHATCEGEDVS